MLQWLYTYVAKVCFQCFICVFGCMLQVCLSGCSICVTHMLQVFYLDVAYVCNGFRAFSGFFASVSEVCKCFICLQTYIATVASGCFKSKSGVCTCCNATRLLQMLEGARFFGSSRAQTPRGVDRRCRSHVGSVWAQTPRRASVGAKCRRVRPDVRTLTLPLKNTS